MGGIFQLIAGTAQQPPIWVQPSFSAFPGGQQSSQSFFSFVADADTATASLTFAQVGTWPSWLTISGTNIVCAQTAPVTTVANLAISANDGTTTVASPTFNVTVVKSVNRAPTWTQSIPSQQMLPTAQTPASFDFRTVTADLDADVLVFQPVNPVILPAGFSINGPLLQCTTAAANGSVALQFRAWDGGSIGAGASTDSPIITFVVTVPQVLDWNQSWKLGTTLSMRIGDTIDLNSVTVNPNSVQTYYQAAATLSPVASLSGPTLTALAAGSLSAQFDLSDAPFGTSTAGFGTPIQLPIIFGTQIAFGTLNAACVSGYDQKIYILGGNVQQAGQALAGSQTLFSFDPASGILAVAYPYTGAAIDEQPSHPAGVGLGHEGNNGARIGMIIGATS